MLRGGLFAEGVLSLLSQKQNESDALMAEFLTKRNPQQKFIRSKGLETPFVELSRLNLGIITEEMKTYTLLRQIWGIDDPTAVGW